MKILRRFAIVTKLACLCFWKASDIGKHSGLLILLFLPVTMVFAVTPRNLAYYLQQAEANSPLIHRTTNDNQVVELDLQQVKAILRQPEISMDANVLLAPIISHDDKSKLQVASNGANSYNGYDLGVSNGGQYQAMLSLRQPLFTQSSGRTYEKKASVSKQINDNTIRLTMHELEQLVTRQYILCMKSKMQTTTSDEQLKAIGEKLQIMSKLVENAIYKRTDELLLQIEYQDCSDTYATNRSDYISNLYDLNLLCGIRDTAVVELEPLQLRLNNLPVAQSQFITSYTLDSLSLAVDLKINNLKYLPQVNFVANGGMNATYIPSFNRLGVSAGLTFSWTLYDGHQRKLEEKKTSYGLQNVAFEKQNFLKQQDVNKEKTLRQIAAFDERMLRLEDQMKTYKSLVAAYELQLSHGNISVMDYKNLLKDVTLKKQDIILNQMEKEALISTYNYWNY